MNVIVPSCLFLAVPTKLSSESYKLNVNSSFSNARPVRFLVATISKVAGTGSSLRLTVDPAAPKTTLYSLGSNLYPCGAVFSLIVNVFPAKDCAYSAVIATPFASVVTSCVEPSSAVIV